MYCSQSWRKSSRRFQWERAAQLKRIVAKRWGEENKGVCNLNSFGVLSFGVPVIDYVPGGPPEGSVCQCLSRSALSDEAVAGTASHTGRITTQHRSRRLANIRTHIVVLSLTIKYTNTLVGHVLPLHTYPRIGKWDGSTVAEWWSRVALHSEDRWFDPRLLGHVNLYHCKSCADRV